MAKIKVLVLGISNNIGGVETYIMNLIRSLPSCEFDFYFPKQSEVLAYESELSELGHIIYTPITHRNIILYKKMWISIFKKYDFDVIYYNKCDLVSIDLLKMAKTIGVPVRIIHSHNSDNQMMINNGVLTHIHRLQEINNKKYLHQYATHFFACSKYAGDWMFGNNVYKIIKNGIPVSKYAFNKTNRDRIRNQHGFCNEKVVGIVGRLSPQKNVLFAASILNSIVKKNSSIKAVFIGDGELRDEVQTAINNYGIQQNVSLIGSVDNVHEWMSAIDCILMPSLFEGLPFVLVEAQAAGLPCIVSSTVSSEANITGLVSYVNLDEKLDVWAEKVTEACAMERPDVTDKLIEAGYSIEATAEEVFSIIEKELSNDEENN